MSIQGTVTLDSGCFLPLSESTRLPYAEVGYFDSRSIAPDVRISIDGQETGAFNLSKLTKKGVIEIHHKKADGSINKSGVTSSTTFHDQLLHMKDLYGTDITPDRKKFDCIIRFDSGHLSASLVKIRSFKLYSQEPDGQLKLVPEQQSKQVARPIAHNILVQFVLRKGEALEMVSDGILFWSSSTYNPKNRIDIEIIADNSTAMKFFKKMFKQERDKVWVPNDGDPPPFCAEPPCVG